MGISEKRESKEREDMSTIFDWAREVIERPGDYSEADRVEAVQVLKIEREIGRTKERRINEQEHK